MDRWRTFETPTGFPSCRRGRASRIDSGGAQFMCCATHWGMARAEGPGSIRRRGRSSPIVGRYGRSSRGRPDPALARELFRLLPALATSLRSALYPRTRCARWPACALREADGNHFERLPLRPRFLRAQVGLAASSLAAASGKETARSALRELPLGVRELPMAAASGRGATRVGDRVAMRGAASAMPQRDLRAHPLTRKCNPESKT